MALHGEASRPLAGLRVLEISSYVAAPFAGKTLAQLGATVVRVDPIGGAPDRHRWPLAPSGASLFWTGLNMGKRSLTIDVADERGRAIVHAWLAACPPSTAVVLTNSIGRSWLSPAALRRHAPDLIHVQIEGRSDGSGAVDYTVNAETGLPMVTGPVDYDGPVNHVLPAWDIACGLYAALGVSAAALRRAETGEGCDLTIALEDVALSVTAGLGHYAEAYLQGIDRPRVGNHIYGTFGRDFRCADGDRIIVATVTARQWRELLDLTESAAAVATLEQALEVDFRDEAQRYRQREALAAIIERWFARHSRSEAEAVLAGSTIPWGRYRTFREIAEAAAGQGAPEIFTMLDQPGVGIHPAAGSPLRVDDRRSNASSAPILGADSETVLHELGWESRDIAALMRAGIVGEGIG